jgi:hypothetical protein
MNKLFTMQVDWDADQGDWNHAVINNKRLRKQFCDDLQARGLKATRHNVVHIIITDFKPHHESLMYMLITQYKGFCLTTKEPSFSQKLFTVGSWAADGVARTVE